MCNLDKKAENNFWNANIDFICVYIYNKFILQKETFLTPQERPEQNDTQLPRFAPQRAKVKSGISCFMSG